MLLRSLGPRSIAPVHACLGSMSAAIGPTAVHIGTDTVGSIRASACASKRPQLMLRPFQQLRPLAILIAIRRASSRVSEPAAVRLPALSSKLMYTSACPVFSLSLRNARAPACWFNRRCRGGEHTAQEVLSYNRSLEND